MAGGTLYSDDWTGQRDPLNPIYGREIHGMIIPLVHEPEEPTKLNFSDGFCHFKQIQLPKGFVYHKIILRNTNESGVNIDNQIEHLSCNLSDSSFITHDVVYYNDITNEYCTDLIQNTGVQYLLYPLVLMCLTYKQIIYNYSVVGNRIFDDTNYSYYDEYYIYLVIDTRCKDKSTDNEYGSENLNVIPDYASINDTRIKQYLTIRYLYGLLQNSESLKLNDSLYNIAVNYPQNIKIIGFEVNKNRDNTSNNSYHSDIDVENYTDKLQALNTYIYNQNYQYENSSTSEIEYHYNFLEINKDFSVYGFCNVKDVLHDYIDDFDYDFYKTDIMEDNDDYEYDLSSRCETISGYYEYIRYIIHFILHCKNNILKDDIVKHNITNMGYYTFDNLIKRLKEIDTNENYDNINDSDIMWGKSAKISNNTNYSVDTFKKKKIILKVKK